MFRRLINSSYWKSQPTWTHELWVAVTWLTLIMYLFPQPLASAFLTLCAVILTFMHMQVSSRLEEAQAKSKEISVECYKKLTSYLISKEVFWILVFLESKNWIALAGVPVFLFYPLWRKTYLRYKNEY